MASASANVQHSNKEVDVGDSCHPNDTAVKLETIVKEETATQCAAGSSVVVTDENDVVETSGSVGDADATSVDDGESIDPYSYIQRGDYTSEIFKIELSNLPKRFGIAQLKKKLVFHGLDPRKIKTEGSRYAFVTFKNEADQQKAITVLQGLVWKNKPLKVKHALPAADPLLKKRKEDTCSAQVDAPKRKMPKLENKSNKNELEDLSASDKLNGIVTPLWKMPYDQQLQSKEKLVRRFIADLGKDIENSNKLDSDWLKQQRKDNRGLCCILHQMKPSPVTDSYRNKCEFTIGRNSADSDNTVGFRIGSYKSGDLSVLEPTDCVNISSSIKLIAKELQQFLQTCSSRSSFNAPVRQGHWQMATVRTTRSGDAMLIVTMHPQDLSSEEIQKEKDLMMKYFSDVCDKQSLLTSLYFQAVSDRGDKSNSCELLLGKQCIEEQLLDLKFRISPMAFFQVNTSAAEILYTSVAEKCQITADTTLVDVCCGTGTIGLTMAKKVKKVIGIELCSEAVEDAKMNAVINGITNSEFMCGKAEDLLPMLMRRLGGQDVVIIVDPPRAGLHADVVRAIRRSSFVKRLVYVSCKPTAAKTNIIDFTRQASKRVIGAPFRLKEALPVDMFPHTDQYELVMLLERDYDIACDTTSTVDQSVVTCMSSTE